MHCFNGHFSTNTEDNGVDNDLKCQELDQKISEKNFSIFSRNNSCDILVKELVSFTFV